MTIRHTSLVLCFFVAGACSGIDSADDNSSGSVQRAALPSDEEILARVYDNTYQWPEDFYVDERADTQRSYTFYHVKDASSSYELCTNDYDQALEWESADNDSRAVNGYFVDSSENDRYFEIVRELSYSSGVGNVTDPTSPGFARVFKCRYVNRDGVDRNLRNGYAGTLNSEVLSESAIRTFTEYMWQFTFFWPVRKKVLESFSSTTDTAYQHTLLLAFKANRGADQCDLIEVVRWVFSADKDSGELTKAFKLLFSMEAQIVDGIPVRCGS